MRFRKQDQIDKKTLEIKQADDDVYTDLDSIAEELPDHMPRFILLSYPLTLVRLDLLVAGFSMLKLHPALRPPLRPLRPAFLYPHYLQCRVANAVCWREGAYAEYCGSRPYT